MLNNTCKMRGNLLIIMQLFVKIILLRIVNKMILNRYKEDKLWEVLY